VLGCEILLHVILLILKIIGIVLLTVLGVVLLAILLILLVPIRYNVNAEKNDNISAVIKAGWLLRILYFKAEYKDEAFIYFVKLFGITIRTNLSKEKKVKESKPKKEKRNTRQKEIKKQTKEVEKTPVATDIKELPFHQEQPIKKEDKTDTSIIKQDDVKQQIEQKLIDNNQYNSEEILIIKKRSKVSILWEKIKNTWNKMIDTIKNLWTKVRNLFRSIRTKVSDWIASFRNIKRKIELCKEFIQDEQNKLGIKYVFQSIKKTLKHSIPRKVTGLIHFGTGDPCSTGQALGVVSLLYAYYGGNIKVVPDFENEIIEGYIQAKGRIRLGTLLIIAIKLLLNDNFKQLVINYRKLKEEL
jgi:hypothetical protein